MNPLTRFSAVTMAEMVGRRDVSATELVEAHLDAARRANSRLNAFVVIDEEGASRAAARADEAVATGKPLGPLHGVPITIKSSIDVAGLPCEAGTRLRKGHVAATDAPLVARLKSAGAIVIGNTTVPEFLMAWETDSALYGRTNSPWDVTRTAGGSSGGEAAAIAACCSAGGIGSDAGGSIRVPAHFSGICGLKPTPGRVPASGHYPPCVGPSSLQGVVGPMARTVADLARLFEITAFADIGDPHAAPVPYRPVTKADLAGIRVGYFEDNGRTPVTPETRRAVRRAVQALVDEGFDVEPVEPTWFDEAVRLWHVLFVNAGAVALRQAYAGREDEMHSIVAGLIALSDHDPPMTAESLLDVLARRDVLRASFLEGMERYPILICPVSAIPAFRHGERAWTIDDVTIGYPSAFDYCQCFNLMGTPGAVVPMDQSPEGLPIGVQIVGRPWQEEEVLAISLIVEQAGGWKEPPCA